MKTIPVSSLLAGMLIPAVCHAQPMPSGRATGEPECEQPASAEHGEPPSGEGRKLAWSQADQNHDGKISKEEFKAIPRVQKLPGEKQDQIFARLDKDGDGSVSQQEMVGFGPPREGKPMRRLWELDTDRSGGISLDEFRQGQFFKKLPPEKLEAMFKRLDTDGDGLITPKDRPQPPPNRGGMGKNGTKPGNNGANQRAREGNEAERQARHINALDTDGDGKLTFAEFRVGPAVKNLTEDEQEDLFEKLDRNRDHRISPEDLPNSRMNGARGEP